MKRFLGTLLVCCFFIAGASGSTNAQNMTRVNLNNRSYHSVYIIAYDPNCRIRVYEGVLANGGNTTVRVCSDNRRRGSIIVYDVHGRSLKFSQLHDGSGVNIRFR